MNLLCLQSLPESPSLPLNIDSAGVRLGFIDGLRAVAILIVMQGHLYLQIYDMGLPRWADIMGLGYLGVHLFLLLSGFCISWAFVGPRPRDMSLREFAYRRASRILPAYYAALLIFTMLALPMPPGRFFRQMATHLTMTHNLFPDTTLTINGVFWSLPLECQLYVAFPLLLTGFRRYGATRTLMMVFALQMAYRLLVWRNLGDFATFTYAYAVFGRVSDFALGIFAAMLVSHTAQKPFGRAWQRAFPCLLLLFFALGMAAKRTLGIHAPLTDVAWSLMFFWMLLAGSVGGSLASRTLTWRPLMALGVISYSVYLMHILPLGYLTRWVRPHLAPVPMLICGGIVVLSGCIAFSYVFYRLVEKPSVDYFARRRHKARALPSLP